MAKDLEDLVKCGKYVNHEAFSIGVVSEVKVVKLGDAFALQYKGYTLEEGA